MKLHDSGTSALRPSFRAGARGALPLGAAGYALLTSVGCASTLPPAPPPAPKVAAPAPPPPPDVTAVPVPHDLVVFARVSNATASLKVATDWARLPALDPSTVVQGFFEGILASKKHAVLATVVDPAQPLDLAATFGADLPPKALGAFSAALKSVDAAKSTLASTFDMSLSEGGIVRLTLRDKHKGRSESSADADESPACEIAPAAGAAPFRLVCGSNQDALNALGPYLTRTTPRETLPADVHVEVRAAPVGGYATLGRLQGPKLLASILGLNASSEPATLDLLTATLGDLFDYIADLDAVTFDATLDPGHAGLAMRTSFKSTTSMIAQLSTAHPDRVDVPPSVFWRLPGDVDLASFGSGVDDSEIQRPRDLVVAAVTEQLLKTKLSEADRRAVVDVVRDSFRGWRGVVAHGMVDASPYWLVESDGTTPVATGEKLVRDLMAALNRPGVAKLLQAGSTATLPPTMKSGPPLAGLPLGSLHVVVTVPDESGPKAATPKSAKGPRGVHEISAGHGALVSSETHLQPLVYHLAIVSDGPRSWLAMSKSDVAVRTALASVTSPTTRADTLGAVAEARGLSGFKDSRMSSGGFLTVRLFLEIAREAMTGRRAAEGARLESVMSRLPAKGITPIVTTAAPGEPSAQDPGGVREIHVSIPADSIRDAVWFGLQVDSLGLK